MYVISFIAKFNEIFGYNLIILLITANDANVEGYIRRDQWHVYYETNKA